MSKSEHPQSQTPNEASGEPPSTTQKHRGAATHATSRAATALSSPTPHRIHRRYASGIAASETVETGRGNWRTCLTFAVRVTIYVQVLVWPWSTFLRYRYSHVIQNKTILVLKPYGLGIPMDSPFLENLETLHLTSEYSEYVQETSHDEWLVGCQNPGGTESSTASINPADWQSSLVTLWRTRMMVDPCLTDSWLNF